MKIAPISEADWLLRISSFGLGHPFLHPNWMKVAAQELSMSLELIEFQNEDDSYIAPVFSDQNGGFSFSSIGYGGVTELSDARRLQQEAAATKCLAQRLQDDGKGRFKRSAGMPLPADSANSHTTFPTGTTSVIPLAVSAEKTFTDILTGNVRTAVRKAQANGVKCRELTRNDIQRLHQLIVETQFNVGSVYLTRLEFIEALFGLNEPTIKCIGAFVDDELSSGVVIASWGEHAFHYLHGWDREKSKLCVNQAVLWSAVEHEVHAGRRWFNMGASHSKSLLEAKLRWGAQPEVYLTMDSSNISAEDRT